MSTDAEKLRIPIAAMESSLRKIDAKIAELQAERDRYMVDLDRARAELLAIETEETA